MPNMLPLRCLVSSAPYYTVWHGTAWYGTVWYQPVPRYPSIFLPTCPKCPVLTMSSSVWQERQRMGAGRGMLLYGFWPAAGGVGWGLAECEGAQARARGHGLGRYVSEGGWGVVARHSVLYVRSSSSLSAQAPARRVSTLQGCGKQATVQRSAACAAETGAAVTCWCCLLGQQAPPGPCSRRQPPRPLPCCCSPRLKRSRCAALRCSQLRSSQLRSSPLLDPASPPHHHHRHPPVKRSLRGWSSPSLAASASDTVS